MDISKIAAANTPKSKMIYHENPEKLHINTVILFLSEKTKIPLKTEKIPIALSFSTANGISDITTVLLIWRIILSKPNSIKPFPFLQTGSFMVTISHSTPISPILFPLTHRLSPTIYR